MKKILTMMAVAAIVAGCAKEVNENELYDVKDGKRVAFLLGGDFKKPSFTRSLTADGQEMTDVWVFDFVDDVCEQFVHKVQGDADFDTPSLTLSNGDHRLCFVVSRGDTPVLDEQHTTITWSRPSDTFWAEYEMAVGALHENRTDMHETCYGYALIEEIGSGICAIVEKRQWFKWNKEKRGYFEIEEPECVKHLANFAIG